MSSSLLNLARFGLFKKTFGPLDEFTDALSSESEVTASAVKAVMHVLKSDILVVEEENDSTLTQDIKTFILDYKEDKYNPFENNTEVIEHKKDMRFRDV